MALLHFADEIFHSIGDYLGSRDLVLLGIGSIVTVVIEKWRDYSRDKREKLRAAQHTSFSWESMTEGAQAIGKKLRAFKPNVIITFAGASSIFANLVLVKCMKRSDLLQIHLYTALFMEKTVSSAALVIPGFKLLESDRFFVLVPEALEREDKEARILVIDDTVTTGSSMRVLKEHLHTLGHPRDRIIGACFVCYQGATLGHNCAADWVHKTTSNADYLLPWGDRL